MDTVFSDLIKAFAEDLGIDPGAAIASPIEVTVQDIAVTLTCDDRSLGDDLVLHTSLGIVPEAAELAVYRGLLEGNLFWSATGDATIGVNSVTREALLAYKRPLAGMTAESLSAALALIAEMTRDWRGFVAGPDEPAPSLDRYASLGLRA